MMASKPESSTSLTDDLSKCLSYTKFKEDLEYHRGNLKKMNDKATAGPKEERLDRDSYTQYLRGSFIQVVATWEMFVQDILKETMEIVIKFLGEGDLGEAVQKIPCIQQILKKAFANESGVQAGDQASQAKALEEYKETLLKKFDRNVLRPVFLGENGIDKRFKTLFETDCCPSEIIIEMGPVSFSFLNKETKNNDLISVATQQGVEDIVRLFYGARCAYAHGHNEKTFQPGGVLHNFPEKEIFQERIGEAPGDQLYIIYKYVKQYGKTAWVYYRDLVNLQRFFLALAFRFFGAVSKWVYDVFKICIWNFDPDKLELKAAD